MFADDSTAYIIETPLTPFQPKFKNSCISHLPGLNFFSMFIYPVKSRVILISKTPFIGPMRLITFVSWRILEANNEKQIDTRSISRTYLQLFISPSYIIFITWPILPKIPHFLFPMQFSWQSTQLTKENYKFNLSGRLITCPERITTWHGLDSEWLGMTGLVTTWSGLRSPELLPLSTLLLSSTGTAITLDLGEISVYFRLNL